MSKHFTKLLSATAACAFIITACDSDNNALEDPATSGAGEIKTLTPDQDS